MVQTRQYEFCKWGLEGLLREVRKFSWPRGVAAPRPCALGLPPNSFGSAWLRNCSKIHWEPMSIHQAILHVPRPSRRPGGG